MAVRRWRGAILLGLLAAIALATAGTGATPVLGGEALEDRIAEVLKTPGYQDAHWGLLIVDATSGATLYEKNADQLFCPASVTKLYSTAAALVDLGADYRFQTPVVRQGEVDEKGTLHGDLILVAQGDLCLGGRTGPDGTLLFEDNDHTYAGGNFNATLVPSDPLAGLDHLAREIKAAGINAVRGDVLVDDRRFEPAASTGSGPSRLSPIVVNDNVIDVVAVPGSKAGDPAEVRMVPETNFATMDAQVETVESDSSPRLVVRAVGPRRFSVRGRVPLGHRPIVKIYEVEEPAAFARALFITVLGRRGVKVEAASIGPNLVEHLPPRAEVARLARVAEYTSPPLREYVRVILKVSHNLHASTLPLLIAAHHGETTLESGLKREGAILKSLGLDVGSISFGGGAGGSRSDLVTPRSTVALLRAMAARPEFRAYDAALPVLGRDGTLAKAVAPDSPARGHVRAKTGTFSVNNALLGKTVLTAKALAGYMETASERPLMITFFLNNVPLDASDEGVSEATAAAGRVLGRLAEVVYLHDAPEAAKPKSDETTRGGP
jgi:D-alanyl-D-alanine carboxypeptidase/D-alanyl-D-alanine-endopeptidase (penicillin-binding protein 4)